MFSLWFPASEQVLEDGSDITTILEPTFFQVGDEIHLRIKQWGPQQVLYLEIHRGHKQLHFDKVGTKELVVQDVSDACQAWTLLGGLLGALRIGTEVLNSGPQGVRAKIMCVVA